MITQQQKPITALQARQTTKQNTYKAIEAAIAHSIKQNRFTATVQCANAPDEFTREVIEHYQGRGFDCSYRFTDSVFTVQWVEHYDG